MSHKIDLKNIKFNILDPANMKPIRPGEILSFPKHMIPGVIVRKTGIIMDLMFHYDRLSEMFTIVDDEIYHKLQTSDGLRSYMISTGEKIMEDMLNQHISKRYE